MKYVRNFQTDIGINFLSHSIRHSSDALIRYINIVNKTTLNNALASRKKRRNNFPVSDQTGAFNVLAYTKNS